MNGLRNEIFSGAAFALDQNRAGFAGGHFVDELHQFRNFSRDADDFAVAGMPPDFAAQGLDFVPQRSCFERILQSDRELFEIDGLADEIVGAETKRRFHFVELRIGGDHDHARGFPGLFDFFENLNPAQVRKVDIEKNGIHAFLLEHLKRLFSRARFKGLKAKFRALLREGPANELVVDNENPFLGHGLGYHRQSRAFIA
jgi:hypothetical protein